MALAEHPGAAGDPSPEEILDALDVVGCLGSGSNSAVLDVRRGEDRLALKVVSHFWVEDAQVMLDSERQILCSLPEPGHPGVIKLHAEFICDIPEAVADHLPSDMRQHYDAWLEEHDGALPRTQFYLLDAHPISLHAWSAKMPLPLPYPLLHRLATDLLAAVAYLNDNCIVHLDCKADNVLMARDGRAVLCDFGIARRTPDDSLDLPLDDPSELLLNRLVLAPEVLHAHEQGEARAAAAAQAAEEAADDDDDEVAEADAPEETEAEEADADAIDTEEAADEEIEVADEEDRADDGDAEPGASGDDADDGGAEPGASGDDAEASPRGEADSWDGGAEDRAADIDPDEADSSAAPVCVLPLAGQGVWAVGVCLLEAAVGWSPFPRYPDLGDGVEAGQGGFGVSYSADGADIINACPIAAFGAAVAMPAEEDLAEASTLAVPAVAPASPRRFSVPSSQHGFSWERLAGVEQLSIDETPEDGDWRVQLRAVQCLGIVAARAYEADSACQVLDVEAFTRAVTEFVSAWSDRDHCLGLAMSAIRNVSCIASEACAVRMARLRSLEWAAYAHSQHQDSTQVTEDALNLCINLLRFSAVCEPDSDAGELDLTALATLAVSASLHHRENSALLDAALSLALSLTEVGDTDEGSEALARAGMLHAADVVLYEARRDRHRVVQVLHLASTILATAKARELQESIHAADLVTRCISLVARDQYADDDELTNLCLLCVRNAACVTATPERVAVAAVSARFSGVVRVDEAMSRFPASEDVQENGRCAMFNLLVASEARASDLEQLASRHDRRSHRSRSEGSASLAASLAEMEHAAVASEEGHVDVGSQTEYAVGGMPGSTPGSPGAPLPGGYAEMLEGAGSYPGPGSDDESNDPAMQPRVPFAAAQQPLAVPASASQSPHDDMPVEVAASHPHDGGRPPRRRGRRTGRHHKS